MAGQRCRKNQFSSKKQTSTQLCCAGRAHFPIAQFQPAIMQQPEFRESFALIECSTQIDCNTSHFPLSGKLFRKLFLCFGGKFNKEENFRRIFSNHKRPARNRHQPLSILALSVNFHVHFATLSPPGARISPDLPHIYFGFRSELENFRLLREENRK